MLVIALKLIAVLSFTLQLAACAVPLPVPYLSKDVSYVTESKLETLVDKSASRKRVIEILGRPLR